ncbi:TSC22 domain family protein 1 isoform X1 [Garra rufa]|uniref:TSC22 domain family protein 1 isoform X1 n=1 Tax=Garra rufa TaxID=137080 RepID=UPI003CCEE099
MHHSDSTGESPGSRRMSHPSAFAGRRGSGATVAPSDDHQTSTLMAHPPPAGSSSPGPHHPPHSLSIQSVGTQVKKKSGFQITSVLPAQVSASGNNSIADDTESYDDMDESHTEDLSSSDILDVSVSRATDTGVPERSSSEETLNSLHGGETPGVTSPNEPVMHQGYMVNGVHHHAHHHKTGRPAALPTVSGGRSVQPAVKEPAPVPVTTDVAAAPVPTGTTMPVTTVAPANPPSTQTQPSTATTASRFRVVKLDSNSEPFRKGRWTCTEYYEKDAPPGDAAAVAHRAVESVIQSEHETTSGSSSGSTLSGGGDVQQGYGGVHAQDPSAHLVPQAAVAPSVLLGVESSSASVRPYSDPNYPANAKPPVSISGVHHTPVEYAQMSTAQPLQIPPIPNAVSPRPVGIPGVPPVAQAVSPRPQVPGPQMGINPDQTGAQLSSSSASSMPSSALQSNLQPLLHGAGVPGQALRAALPTAYVTASQLEDAQRLLLQHHTLLSLPRLAVGGMVGLSRPNVSDAAAALGQEGGASADASAFAVSTGADEDSSSGASVVAIDNKIEQAMDLVKSHLMYAVREEVEVLKEQIKELIERNSQLEQENTLLKNLASPEQLAQFQAEVQTGSPTSGAPPALPPNPGPGPTA